MSVKMFGKKIGMTQIFNKQGDIISVTLIQLGPCTVTQIKYNKLIKKYANIQVGYEYISPQKINKAKLGFFKIKNIPCFKYLKEYKSLNWSSLYIGKILTIKQLKLEKTINISGFTIGKGFSGCQRRHNFSKGLMSHGSKNHRSPGSIGAGTSPGRVFPGKRMAGRMGHIKITVNNLKLIDLDFDKNLIIIKGSIPGKTGNLVSIYQK
uniref:Large ribosomal subunit protein uL3c n=1 Tax=Leachiella pacifica TaxID=282357 RepID=A0A3S8UVU2_9FLOR|nr:ribosomal protein L3 [Leachiella pacifica]